MSRFDDELNDRLQAIRAGGLHRQIRQLESAQGTRVRIAGRELLSFASNDYLGLANHPDLKRAAIRAVTEAGAGSGASRLISGSLMPHDALDQAIARFKGTQAALAFSSGYTAAIGTICALCDSSDVIVLDKLVHASIVDAARLSGAKLRVFAHNDLEKLETILRWASGAGPARLSDSGKGDPLPARARNVLIVTESIFSMDGDRAPLREIVALKESFGAWLMVDEAHATGLIGTGGRGLADELGVGAGIEIQMGTLGKAVGSSGGYISGSRALIDFLVNRARSFIFTTAPVPASAAAAVAGLGLIGAVEGDVLRRLLRERIAQFTEGLPGSGLGPQPVGAILPISIGPEDEAVRVSGALRERGILVPAIRYPSVPRGRARLRLTLSAAHSADDVEQVLEALATVQAWRG